MPPSKPKRRGLSEDQYAAAMEAYFLAMRADFRAHSRAKRERAISLGFRRYEWLASDVHGCCNVAGRNGGMTFAYDAPPPDGHVGEGECGSPDWCRCRAAPVVDFSAP